MNSYDLYTVRSLIPFVDKQSFVMDGGEMETATDDGILFGASPATALTPEALDMIPNEPTLDTYTDSAKRANENILQTFTHRRSGEVGVLVRPPISRYVLAIRRKKCRQKKEKVKYHTINWSKKWKARYKARTISKWKPTTLSIPKRSPI